MAFADDIATHRTNAVAAIASEDWATAANELAQVWAMLCTRPDAGMNALGYTNWSAAKNGIQKLIAHVESKAVSVDTSAGLGATSGVLQQQAIKYVSG